MATEQEIERALRQHCEELVTLACLIGTQRPGTADLVELHRNPAILAAISRCLRSGEQLHQAMAPEAQAGAWRQTVKRFNRERHAAKDAQLDDPA